MSTCLLKENSHKGENREEVGTVSFKKKGGGEKYSEPTQILLVPQPLSSGYLGAEPMIEWYGCTQHIND